VAGQVIGAVSAGATSIDASNTSSGVDVTTGDARADNSASFVTGLDATGFDIVGGGPISLGDVSDSSCLTILGCNFQDGNNRTSYTQSATATSGDGVAGEVIG